MTEIDEAIEEVGVVINIDPGTPVYECGDMIELMLLHLVLMAKEKEDDLAKTH